MGRNERRNRPLGFDIGECWGHSLTIDPATSAGEAVRYVYQNGNWHGRPMRARLMVKTEEIERSPKDHALAMSKIERAREYGCKVLLVLDGFNTCRRRQDYHRYFYEPVRGWAATARDILREVQPDQLEVVNEYWYTKGGADMRAARYKQIVFEVAEGAEQANWKGTLVASNHIDERLDTPHDLWVWDVPWDDCAESEHLMILDGPRNAQETRAQLQELPWALRGQAVGWIWPIYVTETSFTNVSADNDSPEGAAMARAMLEFYRQKNCPLILLTMSGEYDPLAGPGEWGMRSWLVDKDGNLSEACRELLRFVGSDPSWQPSGGGSPGEEQEEESEEEEENPQDPSRPAGQRQPGRRKLERARVALARAIQRWNKPGGPKQAQKAVQLIEEALGRRKD